MAVDHLAYSLLALSLLTGFLSLIATRTKDEARAGALSSYLLAGGALGKPSVLSLLVSSSFGLNSLFYAAWLGYTIGIYALLIHVSWSFSFFLLAKYAWKIRSDKSMHHLLGHAFGSRTRVVAGLFSLAGMMYFIGWEAEIARQTLGELLVSHASSSAATGPPQAASIIATGTIVACLLYTVLGGLRGNAFADLALNVIKVVCVFATVAVLALIAANSGIFSFKAAFLPPWSALLSFGFFAFITNVAFNLAWQFVDASSWQSIIAGRQEAATDAHDNLIASGKAIFIVPNLLGTLVGILLHGVSGVTPDNIVGHASQIAVTAVPWMSIVVGVMIIGSVMSLLDGMFLACAFTFVVDILFPKRNLDELEKEPLRAESILLFVRVGLVVVAVMAAWGVRLLMQAFGVTVFQFVYVMVITQLGLLGPILLALTGRGRPRVAMWLAIVFSVATGFAFAWLGTHGWSSRWADAAGTITAVLSIALALAFWFTTPRVEGPEPAVSESAP